MYHRLFSLAHLCFVVCIAGCLALHICLSLCIAGCLALFVCLCAYVVCFFVRGKCFEDPFCSRKTVFRELFSCSTERFVSMFWQSCEVEDQTFSHDIHQAYCDVMFPSSQFFIFPDLGKFRKYQGGSVRDLLRAMRNKVSV